MYNYQIMSNSFGYIDIILLGMIAGFIILRLRSILGRKTGHQSKVYPAFAEKKFNMPKNIVKSGLRKPARFWIDLHCCRTHAQQLRPG